MTDVDTTYFQGKTWLIYGRLPNIPKKESTAAIKSRGGRIVTSVSSKLDYLVTSGPTPEPMQVSGVKAKQAVAVGAKVIGEPEFLRLLEGEDPFAEGADAEDDLKPLPDEVAAINYPGPEVDLEATYFKDKRWFMYGALESEYGYGVAKGWLGRRLKEYGARLVNDIAKADYVVHEGDTPLWGARLSDEVQAARDAGVAIFGSLDFFKLLKGERPGPATDDDPSVHDAFSELRHLLHTSGDTFDCWPQIKAMLTDLDDTALEVATDYVNAFLDQLPTAERRRAVIADNLLAQALRGNDDPMLSVGRVVTIRDKLTGAKAQNLLSCSHLSRCEVYSLTSTQAAPQKHWALLAEATHLSRLEVLRFHNQAISKRSASALSDAAHLRGVTELSLRNTELKAGAPAALFTPDSFPELTSLNLLKTSHEDDELFQALTARAFPKLTTLLVRATPGDGLAAFLADDALAPLRALTVSACTTDHLAALTGAAAIDGLTDLDLEFSGAGYADSPFWQDARLGGLKRLRIRLGDDDGAFLRALVRDAPFAESLEELELRAWNLDWTEHLQVARLPQLRRVTLDLAGANPFSLKALFPRLEREIHTRWDGHYRHVVEHEGEGA